MVEKRELEPATEAPAPKRSRFEPAPEAAADGNGAAPASSTLATNGAQQAQQAPAAATAVPKPALSLEAIAKAKEALRKQKELQEKMKKLKEAAAARQAAAAGAAAAPQAAAAAAALPPPPSGPLGPLPPPPAMLPSAAAAAALFPMQQQQADEASETFYDPAIGRRGMGRLQRRARGFDFVEQGSFEKAAESIRLKAAFGDKLGAKGGSYKAAPPPGSIDPNKVPIGGFDPNKVPLGAPQQQQEEEEKKAAAAAAAAAAAVPDVEWWDKPLLPNGSYDDVTEDGSIQIKENKITHLVEHPVPIDPPAEAPPPPPQPLKLTKKELKKLRTQRRQAREKEKQDLIRQGLLEPPKPKVRLANLPRVLGEQAAADPTAIELEVRKQMAERQAAHEDRNLSRQLTPAERSEKKLKKLLDDNGVDNVACVYKINHLDLPQHRFKVVINAQENHLSGLCLIADPFCLVIVEGCGKSAKRYMKLMLRRVDWQQEPDFDQLAKMDPALRLKWEEREEVGENVNVCQLVWQGVIKKPAFRGFTSSSVGSAAAARGELQQHGVAHYWDAAESFVPELGPAVAL